MPASRSVFRVQGYFLLFTACLLLSACCNEEKAIEPPAQPSVSLTLASGSAVVPQDGTAASVNVTIARTGTVDSVALTATGLPEGMQAQFVHPGSSDTGSVTLTSSASVPAGAYSVQIRASDGSVSDSKTLAVEVGIVASIQNAVDTNLGVGGRLQQFMSVHERPVYIWPFVTDKWDPLLYSNLNPHHTRIEIGMDDSPMKANTGQASDWDFWVADQVLKPALEQTDHSPSVLIAFAPKFLNSSHGLFDFTPENLKTFAEYCANLVRYYNAGGFDWGGTHFQSSSSRHIQWWSIYDEYNAFGVTPAQYLEIYNTVVPAMLAVDPTIKVTALELATSDEAHCFPIVADCSAAYPQSHLPYFFAPKDAGGVKAPVDSVAVHLFSSCNRADTDEAVFSTIPLASDVLHYYRQQIQSRPDLASAQLWVTENAINVDWDRGDGNSACTGTPYADDQRGTSAFFAAYRPYVFSVLGKAGNQALFHRTYIGGPQDAMLDYSTGAPYLSYWVNYWLAQKFPWDETSAGSEILAINATESSNVETLATRNADGSAVVMIANHAVQSPNDNNGQGAPRTVIVDLSSLGTFASATRLTIDATTNPASGPTEVPTDPSSRMTVTLNGYGVTFLTLQPAL